MEVVLTHPTPEGSEDIVLDGGKLSFGRGSEADQRFDDDGLSRLHSTVYRDGDNVWVVDENSTNGTFVNGEQVRSSGTPLRDGDTIKIGNYTNLKVRFVEKQTAPTPSFNNQTKSATVQASAGQPRSLTTLIPIVAISIAIFAISISAVVIGIKIFSKDEPVIVQRNTDDDTPEDDSNDNENDNKNQKTPTQTATPKGGNSSNLPPTNGNPIPNNSPETSPQNTPVINLGGKKYLELSDTEKTNYVEERLKKIAGIIGNRASDEIPTSAVNRIKTDVTGYAKRINTPKSSGAKCKSSRLGDDLQTTYERARDIAPTITKAFTQEGIDPQVGLYIAMIESEYCPCVQSGTGPLGMFQFAYAAATEFFPDSAKIVKGSKPPNGDDRCNPEIAAKGSARYVKYLMGWFGTGPASVPLSIASYNSGQGAMRKNLLNALKSDPSLSRDFWTLIANSDKLSQQFQDENFKYPPKFFAAAIIGENPTDFGLSLQPISSYTK